MDRTAWAPVAALLVVQGFFGSLAVIGKIVLAEVPPLLLLALRIVPAAGVFFVFERAFVRERLRDMRDVWVVGGLSLLGVVLNMGLFLFGLARTTPTNAIVLITSIPVFTLLVAVLLGHERLRLGNGLGLGLALGGVLFLLGSGFAAQREYFVGNLFVVMNSLSYAIYLVLSRPLLARYDPITLVTYTFLWGAVFAIPLGLYAAATSDLAAISGRAWWGAAYVVVFVTIVVYYLNNWALRRVPSSTVAIYIYIQPLVAALLAYLLLDEVPTTRTIIAAVPIFVGVALATRRAPPATRAAVPQE